MIDPTIALSFRPPDSPVEMQAKVAALQSQKLQQQAARQQIAASDLDLQMKQRAMQDQEIARQAYMDSGGDLPTYEKLLMTRGASPNTIFAFKQQLLAQREKLAAVNKDELANTATRHDQLRGAMQTFAQQSPDFKQANWKGFLDQQLRSGNMTPEEYQQHVSSFGEYPGDDQLRMDMNSLATGSQLAKEAIERQNADANTSRATSAATQAKTAKERFDIERGGLQADANRKQRENLSAQLAAAASPDQYTAVLDAAPMGIARAFPTADKVFDQAGKPVPAAIVAVRQLGMSAEQQQNAETQAKNAENNVTEAELAYRAKHDPDPQRRADADAALKRLDQSKLASRPNMTVMLPGMGGHGAGGSQLTGDEYLQTLPQALAAQVKAVAEGRDKIPPANSRTQAAIDLRNAVYQYEPNFTEQRAQIRKAFTAGNDGRNIGALNTAAVHLDQLSDVAKAMQNDSFRPGNDLFNRARAMFGSSLPTNFEALKSAVAGEVANALKGNATDVEIHNIAASIQAANSPEQLAGVIDTHLHTLGAKLNTYAERYHQQLPDDKVWSPVLPAAQEAFSRHGVNPLRQQGGAAAGAATHRFNLATGKIEAIN